MALTQKQEAFCLAHIETGNASEAYRRVYNTSRMKAETINRKAKELMDNGKITARLIELNAPALERANVTIEWVAANLVEVVERCMQRAPVMVRAGRQWVQAQDDEGRDIWQFDSKGANSALTTLARYKGMLTDKIQADVNAKLTAAEVEIIQIPDNGRD